MTYDTVPDSNDLARARGSKKRTRIQVENAEPLGSLLGWKPYRTVIQWAVEKA